MIRRSFVKSGIAALVALQLGTVIFLTAGATLIGVGMASLLSNKKKQDYRKATVVKSVCLSCSTVCGIEGFVIDGKVVQIRDNPLDPNMGSYMPCAKGQSGPSINDYPERLLSPLKRVGKRGDGLWKRITWDEACSDICSRIQRRVDGGHPERVAWHQGRSRIDAEINRFLNAIGTPVQPDHRALCSANKRAANSVGLGYTDWE